MSIEGIELPVRSPATTQVIEEAQQSAPAPVAARTEGRPWVALLAIPFAVAVTMGVHFWAPDREPTPDTHFYVMTMAGVAGLAVLLAVVQEFWGAMRRWMVQTAPIIAAGVLAVCAWEMITLKFALLPLPYFPGPEGVLESMVSDRGLLFESTRHSLMLLMGGYALGVIAGLISGVTIGWSSWARYWGMPVLKVVGPIPATAWVPLAMVVFPSALLSAVSLIALAVWFPVTMLAASGVSNVKTSYLDVARTLGARRPYLIFRVAIPAAMPSIFIGLFMGLGASFLTLVVAETVGVKAGLGWYVSWAQGWAEYGKVYAALIIMAAFFSTIMTLLFKVRDRILVWQKGTIKW
jgi:NitT/TauT family transport system permease protein